MASEWKVRSAAHAVRVEAALHAAGLDAGWDTANDGTTTVGCDADDDQLVETIVRRVDQSAYRVV